MGKPLLRPFFSIPGIAMPPIAPHHLTGCETMNPRW